MLLQPACAKTLYVGDDGYDSIQDAINHASGGDTVYVHSGLYEEHVKLDKSITLEGENAASTTIVWHSDDVINVSAKGAVVKQLTVQGAPEYSASIRVYAKDVSVEQCVLQNSSYGLISYASGCSVKENTARYNSRYGIAILHSQYGVVEKNTASNNTLTGIHIHDSEGIEVKGNTLKGNGVYGVYIGNGSSCKVKSNTITLNRYGIWLRKSDENEIKYNNASNNIRYGILLTDGNYHVDGSDNNTVMSNNIDGNADGVYLYNSNDNLVRGNTMCYNAMHGCILLEGSEQNTIQSNTMMHNHYGVKLVSSPNNTIKGNTINDNTRVGIMLSGASYGNLVDGNTARRCYYGAYVHDSHGNSIKNGTFSKGFVGIYLGNVSDSTIDKNMVSSSTYGVYLRKSSHNTITKNTATTNTNYSYMMDQQSNDNVLSNNTAYNPTKGSIYIGHSSSNVVSEENYTGGTYGVLVFDSSSNVLSGCSLKGNKYGAYLLASSQNNTIEQCTITSPTGIGILLDDAHENHIKKNTIILPNDMNGKGIYLSGKGNIIEQNEITSHNPTAVDGIYVNAVGSNTLSANKLTKLVSGILVMSGDAQSITNNDIESCSYGIQIWGEVKDTYLSANLITSTNAGIAVIGNTSNATNTPTNTTVLNNTLKRNNIDVSFLWGTPTASVSYNDLSDGATGIGASGVVSTFIDGTNNWWGAPSGPGRIANGGGVKVTANITYSPWLASAP